MQPGMAGLQMAGQLGAANRGIMPMQMVRPMGMQGMNQLNPMMMAGMGLGNMGMMQPLNMQQLNMGMMGMPQLPMQIPMMGQMGQLNMMGMQGMPMAAMMMNNPAMMMALQQQQQQQQAMLLAQHQKQQQATAAAAATAAASSTAAPAQPDAAGAAASQPAQSGAADTSAAASGAAPAALPVPAVSGPATVPMATIPVSSPVAPPHQLGAGGVGHPVGASASAMAQQLSIQQQMQQLQMQQFHLQQMQSKLAVVTGGAVGTAGMSSMAGGALPGALPMPLLPIQQQQPQQGMLNAAVAVGAPMVPLPGSVQIKTVEQMLSVAVEVNTSASTATSTATSAGGGVTSTASAKPQPQQLRQGLASSVVAAPVLLPLPAPPTSGTAGPIGPLGALRKLNAQQPLPAQLPSFNLPAVSVHLPLPAASRHAHSQQHGAGSGGLSAIDGGYSNAHSAIGGNSGRRGAHSHSLEPQPQHRKGEAGTQIPLSALPLPDNGPILQQRRRKSASTAIGASASASAAAVVLSASLTSSTIIGLFISGDSGAVHFTLPPAASVSAVAAAVASHPVNKSSGTGSSSNNNAGGSGLKSDEYDYSTGYSRSSGANASSGSKQGQQLPPGCTLDPSTGRITIRGVIGAHGEIIPAPSPLEKAAAEIEAAVQAQQLSASGAPARFSMRATARKSVGISGGGTGTDPALTAASGAAAAAAAASTSALTSLLEGNSDPTAHIKQQSALAVTATLNAADPVPADQTYFLPPDGYPIAVGGRNQPPIDFFLENGVREGCYVHVASKHDGINSGGSVGSNNGHVAAPDASGVVFIAPAAVLVLKLWLARRWVDPYPTMSEARQLMRDASEACLTAAAASSASVTGGADTNAGNNINNSSSGSTMKPSVLKEWLRCERRKYGIAKVGTWTGMPHCRQHGTGLALLGSRRRDAVQELRTSLIATAEVSKSLVASGCTDPNPDAAASKLLQSIERLHIDGEGMIAVGTRDGQTVFVHSAELANGLLGIEMPANPSSSASQQQQQNDSSATLTMTTRNSNKRTAGDVDGDEGAPDGSEPNGTQQRQHPPEPILPPGCVWMTGTAVPLIPITEAQPLSGSSSSSSSSSAASLSSQQEAPVVLYTHPRVVCIPAAGHQLQTASTMSSMSSISGGSQPDAVSLSAAGAVLCEVRIERAMASQHTDDDPQLMHGAANSVVVREVLLPIGPLSDPSSFVAAARIAAGRPLIRKAPLLLAAEVLGGSPGGQDVDGDGSGIEGAGLDGDAMMHMHGFQQPSIEPLDPSYGDSHHHHHHLQASQQLHLQHHNRQGIHRGQPHQRLSTGSHGDLVSVLHSSSTEAGGAALTPVGRSGYTSIPAPFSSHLLPSSVSPHGFDSAIVGGLGAGSGMASAAGLQDDVAMDTGLGLGLGVGHGAQLQGAAGLGAHSSIHVNTSAALQGVATAHAAGASSSSTASAAGHGGTADSGTTPSTSSASLSSASISASASSNTLPTPGGFARQMSAADVLVHGLHDQQNAMDTLAK